MNKTMKVMRMLTGAKCAAYVVFTLFSAVVIVARPGAAASLVETIKQVKPSIVGVGTYQEITRPPSKLLGTGFLVGDNRHIITNSHVLPKSLRVSRREFYCIFVGKGRNASIVRVEVVMRDETHDIALLRAVKPVDAKPMTLRPAAELAEGEHVAFTGFPIGTVLGLHPVTHRGIISAKTPIAIPQATPKDLDPKMIKRLRGAFEVYQLDATAYPGNSGSPLYDPLNGEVIGIVSSVFVKSSKEKALSDPSGITYAIPIDFAIRMLEKAGLVKP